MVVAGEDHQRIGQEFLRHHVFHLRRVREQVEIVLVVREPPHQRLPVVGLHRGLDAGVKRDVGAQQTRGEARARRADGKLQPTGFQRAHARERFLERGERAEHLMATLVESPARVGEVDALAHLLEQRNADRFGKLLDLHRGRRLGHVQLLGGAGEIAQARGRLEEVKLRQRPVPQVPVDVRW